MSRAGPTAAARSSPIQAIWADGDTVFGIGREGALLREAIGLTRIESVPGKHLVADEQADLLAERIAAFAHRPSNAGSPPRTGR